MGTPGPAIEQARRALERFPTNVKVQLLLAGLLAQQEGTRNEAIERYQSVLRANPENRLARLGLAEAQRAQGRTLDAIQAFTALVERDPNEPRYHVRLGQLYGSLGDLTRARMYFERAHALGPSNREAVTSLAILGDVQDRPQDAVRYYEELLKLYPDDVSAQIAARLAKERASEPQFPVSIDEMEQTPLERYQEAVPENSKQLKQRREQIEATRSRSVARFLPSFFFSPSFGTVHREPKPAQTDHSNTNAFSFGWNLADIVANPYKINITGMVADFEAVKAGLLADVSGTYYQRRQSLLQYRQLQHSLALDPQNAQIRQNKQIVKYTILNLTERLKLITGIP
jgi:tetratricopeptide (TPR) repeat protein